MAELERKPRYPRFQDPKQNNPPPKKKKNAPDRPQPAWLFPPDEENPVLNPKPKSDEKLQKETDLRNKSLDYMKRRVHGAPDRPAPSHLLLTLVGAFLTENGFNSTSRLFTNERKARQVLSGWQNNLGQQLEKGMPSLESMFKDFYQKWQISRADETSSSGSGSEESSSEASTSSSDGSNSDTSMQSTSDHPMSRKPPVSDPVASELDSSDAESGTKIGAAKKEAATKSKRMSKRPSVSSSSSLSSSSSSDSDADDELGPVAKGSRKLSASVESADPKSTPYQGIKVTSTVSKKRKASTSSSAETSSSDSSRKGKHSAKRSKTTASASKKATTIPGEDMSAGRTLQTKEETSSSESDSSTSDAESSSSGSKAGAQIPASGVENRQESSASSSSATISGDVKPPSESLSSQSTSVPRTSSDSSSDDFPPSGKPPAGTPTVTKKHRGAKPTSLAEASAEALAASHPSNAYQAYNYADRAYQDLSVTRGKGFTKEKNKKKRGSYRGGTIDTGAGKGFKFTD